jgi:arabinogalactan oligomer / maltooligosaccharide transport system substrate-binding protein
MRGHRLNPGAWLLVLGLAVAACSTGPGQTTSPTAAPTSAPGTTGAAGTTTTPTTGAPTTTGPAETTTTSPAGLLVWVDEARRAVVQTAADDFTADTGVTVEVAVVGFGDIHQRMLDQAPLGGGADLFLGSHEWLADLFPAHVTAALDLGSRAADYLPVGLEAFSRDGALYGVPYSLEAVALYRNTALVPNAPATFEDLLASCDDLAGEMEVCLAIPTGDAYYNYPFLASGGGYVFGHRPDDTYDTTDIGLDGAGALAGMAYLDELVSAGYLDAAVDYGTMTRLFLEGRAAFMWTAQWALPDAEAAVAAGTLPGYAVSPLPRILGHDAVPFVRAQGFMVNAFSARREVATRFLVDYLATRQAMAALYDADPRPPAHAAVLAALADDPLAQAFGASAAAGQPIPNVPEMAPVWAALGEAFTAVYLQAQGPGEALRVAAAAVREALGG